MHLYLLLQVSGRVITATQQKPAKTVTARVTARSAAGKASRNNLQVMGVTPPMSSVIVERHYPTAQVLSQFALPSLMRCSYAFLQIKSWSTFLFAFRSFSKLLAKLQLLSFLTLPNRAKAPPEGEAHPECTPARAMHTPSKWSTDHTFTYLTE